MTASGESAGRVTEDFVFACLQSSRRPGDVVWRNQRLTSDARNAEVDFLLGLPGSGLIALEVKGGNVSVVGDAWIQQSKGGYRKRINPMTQAREGMYGLRDYVEADPRWRGRGHARWGHAVILPFSNVEDDFVMPDCPRHMIFGRNDLEDLVPKLADIADRQQRDRPASPDDVALVGEILLARGHPQAEMLDAARDDEALSGYLTQQQRTILDVTKQLTRIEIRGGPGSGKTFLGLEHARRLSQDGRRVALVCASEGLAAFLQRATRPWSRRQRPAFIGGFAGFATASRVRRFRRFDAIIVDEAHDFEEASWPVIIAALRDPELGALMLLNDRSLGRPVQVRAIPECQAVLVLEHNLRNSGHIAEALEPLAPIRMRNRRAGGPVTRLVQCSASEAVAAANDVVNGLLESGWHPGDIALLTTTDPHPAHLARQNGGDPAYWDSFWDDSQVFYGHALEFKGLERPVVVLAVNEYDSDRPRERLYVGMSRACDELVVCGDAAYLDSVGGPELVQALRNENVMERHEGLA